MGMYDEVLCSTPVPERYDGVGTRIQTRSVSSSCLQRYWITAGGRLVDTPGSDLEPDGYITFYASDPDSTWRKYRARFLAGELSEIVRVSRDADDQVRYGLASYRWFSGPSFILGDEPEESGDAQSSRPVSLCDQRGFPGTRHP